MIREETIVIPFRYAPGAVASRFLRALCDDATILGSRCRRCSRVACPARSICPWCGADTDELERVGPAGELVAVTHTPDRGAYGLIRLDGADGAMIHRLAAEDLRPATRVVAVFADERHGRIDDIVGFRREDG